MRRYRILEFASFAGIGGTQTMLLEFLRQVSPSKFQFSVCVLLEHGYLNTEVAKLGIEQTSLNMRGYWDLAAWRKLYAYAKSRKFDLIRTYGLKAHIIGRIVGRLIGIPVNITSVRNTDPWRKWYHALLDYGTSPLTDLYISNSEAGRIATHQREHIPLSKIITIPNGIDLNDYAPYHADMPRLADAVKQEFGIATNAPVIGIIANLRRQKGHITIIDALPRILAEVSEVVCVCVGDDLMDGEIQRYAQSKGMRGHIVFTGFRPDIPRLLTMFDIFLLPSLYEGIPRALLEAMAMKKPTITTAAGGMPEVVVDGSTGVIIPSNDPPALAEAVITLLTNPDRTRAMEQASYERIRAHFSLKAVVAQTVAAYERLING